MDDLDKAKADRVNVWGRRVQKAKEIKQKEKDEQNLLIEKEQKQLSQSAQGEQNSVINAAVSLMDATAPTVMQLFKSFNELPFSPQQNRVSLNSTEIQAKSPVEKLSKSKQSIENQNLDQNALEFSSIAPLISFSTANLTEESFQVANQNVQMENSLSKQSLESSIFSMQIDPSASPSNSTNPNFLVFEENRSNLRNLEGSPGGQVKIPAQKSVPKSIEKPQSNEV